MTQSSGCPSSLALAPLETSSTTVPRIATPAIQPIRNAGPFEGARGVASMSTTPMIGIGLIATATAKGRI